MALALLAGACTSGSVPDAAVISTSNTIGVGEQRILVEFTQSLANDPVATLRNEDGSPLDEDVGAIVWLVEDERAAYAFYLDIPEAETYQLTFEVGGEILGPLGFVAVDDPVQVSVGESAPPIHGNNVGSLVVVFASPDWCPSGSCQPMLDLVERVAGVSLAQIDVFENPEVDDEADLVLSTTVEVWNLPSQPWLYVIDNQGIVTAVFEGAVSEEELREAVG